MKDLFARYLATGLGLILIIQTFVNLGVNLNIVPLTGVTLPFISYGGSSLLSLMISTGILLQLSRFVEIPRNSLFSIFSRGRQVYGKHYQKPVEE